MRNLSPVDQFLFGLMNASLLFTLVYWILGFDTQFATGFAIEDGPVEYGTAVMLFVSALVLAWHSARQCRKGQALAGLCLSIYALIFVFGTGEEISWGQRILGLETPASLREVNFQEEITLHNIVVGGKQLTKTVFGSGLTVAILLYLLALPALYGRSRLVTRIADRLAWPVPSWRHGIMGIVASVVMLVVEIPRQWEVYEFVFSLLTTSIFLAPANTATFGRPDAA
ncbi:hypothetical protein FIU89_19840 [Roseovarius sp. THAF27]|uniref:hypothetical protein n=1 Tax=Roseovarius sp. THAF27 TaxID=2587850 RepID=UPI001267DB8D|nr:hypothetical protein [Roseovarius sp. THAF27]QFT82884.1 hypothetical protein FIU89_19840 [Roseovarius sp. THAF27]